MTVLIAGCGDLGTEVGLRLAALGHRVVGLRRSSGVLPVAIEGQAVDLTRERPVVPADTDIVIVAIAAAGPTADAYRTAYVDGLRNLLDALDAAGVEPSRFLLVSSTAVYGVDDGSWIDEGSPAVPSSETGAVLLEAEDLLRGRLPGATVLRLAGIYGPGRERLIGQVRAGTSSAEGLSSHTNRIHRDDAAAAIVHLVTGAAEPASLYLGADSLPARRRDVLAFLAAELGVPDPVGVASRPSTVVGESADSPASPVGRAGRASPGPRGGDKRCRNALLLASGFRFAYPSYREGYRSLLAGVGIRHP
ncbi:NAD-dependent epimerase/dehydratase family protein [Cryobacterium sp. GrIS_2_6]|uniref:NAD-dependent epimerase/dehydratase family protein n=1 Tax=Cryobacterium sp. GrIS_2_6 TaxID=3162785 RepID=UPI002DFDEAFF|nr:NAD-dependent epimerase/dehydratase family protein [Cryobacterium psychrotolerans]MEC5149502.1 nucleoside-diphosphate-sugar epimerase [Cryobacterium psychrotolerans]